MPAFNNHWRKYIENALFLHKKYIILKNQYAKTEQTFIFIQTINRLQKKVIIHTNHNIKGSQTMTFANCNGKIYREENKNKTKQKVGSTLYL